MGLSKDLENATGKWYRRWLHRLYHILGECFDGFLDPNIFECGCSY